MLAWYEVGAWGTVNNLFEGQNKKTIPHETLTFHSFYFSPYYLILNEKLSYFTLLPSVALRDAEIWLNKNSRIYTILRRVKFCRA